MMEEEVVVRRAWLDRRRFLDLVGATNLIPGPNSTEMAIHVGYLRGGWRGLIVAGACFILPAVTITGVFAWGYVRYGSLPEVEPFLAGIEPAVLAVILAALWRLGKTAATGHRTVIVGVAVAAAVLLGLGELPALAAGGVLGMLWLVRSGEAAARTRAGAGGDGDGAAGEDGRAAAEGNRRDARERSEEERPEEGSAEARPEEGSAEARPDEGSAEARPDEGSEEEGGGRFGGLALAVPLPLAGAAAQAAAEVSLAKLGLFFLKVGSVLYGSGYVLVAFLEGDLVRGYGWLTRSQLLDAIAIGQFTPGPVLSTSTFIGYLVADVPGAIVATLGIFLPSFFFVLALSRILPRLRESRWTAGFLDAVNAAALGLMAAVTVLLATDALVDWRAWSIALGAAVAALGFRVGAAWLVLGGAVAGWLLRGGPGLG